MDISSNFRDKKGVGGKGKKFTPKYAFYSNCSNEGVQNLGYTNLSTVPKYRLPQISKSADQIAKQFLKLIMSRMVLI